MVIVKLMLGLSHLIGQIVIVTIMVTGTLGILIWGFLVSFRFHLFMGAFLAFAIYWAGQLFL